MGVDGQEGGDPAVVAEAVGEGEIREHARAIRLLLMFMYSSEPVRSLRDS